MLNKQRFKCFVVFMQTLLLCAGHKTSYRNYKLYNIVPRSEYQVNALNYLRDAGGVEFWSDVDNIGHNTTIMVAPDEDDKFRQYINDYEMKLILKIQDLQELIDTQMQMNNNGTRNNDDKFGWNRYYELSQIYAWLDELETVYPNVVSTIVMGKSYEGRDIKGIKIDFKRNQRSGTTLIGMIEGGIHPNEWISPATVTYIINEFLTSNDPSTRFIAEHFVWHIFPIVNPDGYDYTFTGDRLWRKNRNVAISTSCIGIDLNRNFDFQWNTVGVSSDPCQWNFPGRSVASEPEVQAISSYVLNLKEQGNFTYYIAFHSYSQMILIPHSHLSGVNVHEVANYEDLYEIAIRGAEKLKARHGTEYTVGTAAEILYAVSGASFDWVKDVAQVPIVHLFELRDLGEFGFLLPAEQIIPNCEEVMDAILEMDRVTRQLGYYSGTTSIYTSLLTMIVGLYCLIILQ